MIKMGLFCGLMAVIYAVFFIVPPAQGLGNFVRIAFFHIPVAWVSVLAFLLSAYWATQYLRTREMKYDWKSAASARLGFLFCVLATISGAVFAKLTWGVYWNWDPRQISIFILLLIYGAYMTLRSAIEEEEQKAKISAVYSLLSFVTVPFLIFIIPRFYFSLHPEPIINHLGRVDMDNVMLYVLLLTLGVCTALFWGLLSSSVSNVQKRHLANPIHSNDKDKVKI